MKIAVIVSMYEEVKEIVERLDLQSEDNFGAGRLYAGDYSGHEIFVVEAGIGKVHASLGATLAIERFNPDALFNVGVAGGVGSGLTIGDMVIGTSVAHYNFDVTPFGYEYGQVPGRSLRFEADEHLLRIANSLPLDNSGLQLCQGPIISSDEFIHKASQINLLRRCWPDVLAVDMESAAMGQVCEVFSVPFLTIRCMSDIVSAADNQTDYSQSLSIASGRAAGVLMRILRLLQ